MSSNGLRSLIYALAACLVLWCIVAYMIWIWW